MTVMEFVQYNIYRKTASSIYSKTTDMVFPRLDYWNLTGICVYFRRGVYSTTNCSYQSNNKKNQKGRYHK
jgi:hypothetical protein